MKLVTLADTPIPTTNDAPNPKPLYWGLGIVAALGLVSVGFFNSASQERKKGHKRASSLSGVKNESFDIHQYGIKELRGSLTLDKLKKYHSWILKAQIEDAVLSTRKGSPQVLIWHSGTWINGTSYGMTWLNGTWKRGRWVAGGWKNGVWESGVWENGLWQGGTWKRGTWRRGYVYDGGVFVYTNKSPNE